MRAHEKVRGHGWSIDHVIYKLSGVIPGVAKFSTSDLRHQIKLSRFTKGMGYNGVVVLCLTDLVSKDSCFHCLI